MHYLRTGNGAPPLVLVHGFACSHEDWRLQTDFFSRTNETLACDLRGHGATPGRPQECSIEHYGGDVAALLGTLDLKNAILVGHSMGCRVVLEAARLDAERVAGLVLIDGSRQAAGDADAAEKTAHAMLEAAGYAAFAKALFEAMFLAPSETSRAVVKRALQLPAEIGSALFPRMARWDAAQMDAAVSAVKVPVLAIQSTYLNTERKRVPMAEGQTTPWLDLLRQKIPGVKISILSGYGHFPQLEAAVKVNRLIGDLVGFSAISGARI